MPKMQAYLFLLLLPVIASALTLNPAYLTGTAGMVAGASNVRWHLAFEAGGQVAQWEGSAGAFSVAVPVSAGGRALVVPSELWREHTNANGSVEHHGWVSGAQNLSAGQSVALSAEPPLDNSIALTVGIAGTCTQTLQAEVVQVLHFLDLQGKERQTMDRWFGSVVDQSSIALTYSSLPALNLFQSRDLVARVRCGNGLWLEPEQTERIDSARGLLDLGNIALGTLQFTLPVSVTPATATLTGSVPQVFSPFTDSHLGQVFFRDDRSTWSADPASTWSTSLPASVTGIKYQPHALLPWEHSDGSVGVTADHWWDTPATSLNLVQGAATQTVDFFAGSAELGSGHAAFRHNEDFTVNSVQIAYDRPAQTAGGAEWGRGVQSGSAELSFPLRHTGTYRFAREFPMSAKLTVPGATGTPASVGDLWLRNVADATLAPNTGLEIPVAAGNSPLLYTIPTGQVTVRLDANFGAKFQNPWLEIERIGEYGGTSDNQRFHGVFRRAIGPVDTGSVTAIVLPGRLHFRGFAMVGDAQVEFGSFDLDVRDGDKLVVVDPNEPTIVLTSPSPALGTCVPITGITVSGTVDSKGATLSSATLTVDGTTTNLTLTGSASTWVFTGFWVPPATGTSFELQISVVTATGKTSTLMRTVNKLSGATSIAYSTPASTPATVAHAQSRITLQGTVSAPLGAVPSVIMNDGASVPVDPSNNQWSRNVSLAAGTNTFTAYADGLCSIGPTATTVINRPNALPVVNFSCSPFTRIYTGASLPLSATATDPDNDPLSAYSWQFEGSAIANTQLASYTPQSAGALQFCATDNLGGSACGLCAIDPLHVVSHGCGKSDSTICGNDPEDGPEYNQVSVRHDADSIYFLLETCSATAFESDEYLYLDLIPNVGDNSGYDKRIVIDFYRPSRTADKVMLMRAENWNASTGRWEYVSEAYPGGINPRFALNSASQTGPKGTTNPAGQILEIAVARPAGYTSIDWSFTGSRYSLDDLSGVRYSLLAPTHTMSVDGRTCDWNDQVCPAILPPDPTTNPSDWTIASTQPGITVVADNSVSNGDGSSLAIYAGAASTRVIETPMKWSDLMHTKSISYDVMLPKAPLWWAGGNYLTINITNCSPFNIQLPVQNYGLSYLDGLWHTWTWAFDADAILAQYSATNTPLQPNCDVKVQLGVNVDPQGDASKPVRIDNLMFVK